MYCIARLIRVSYVFSLICATAFKCFQNGNTAAMFAAKKGHVAIVETLVARGANYNAKNNVSLNHSQWNDYFFIRSLFGRSLEW